MSAAQHRRLTDLRVRLQGSFEPLLSEHLINAIIDDSTSQLAPRSRKDDLASRVEAFATERLTSAARLNGTLTPAIPTVLIVSNHDAGRSQMAAGWLQRLYADRLTVQTAGLEPGHDVSEQAEMAMRRTGITLQGRFPKPLTDECRLTADYVVSVTDPNRHEPPMRWSHEHWRALDISATALPTACTVRDELRARVDLLAAKFAPTA